MRGFWQKFAIWPRTPSIRHKRVDKFIWVNSVTVLDQVNSIFFTTFSFISFISKIKAQTSLIVQSQSKKCGIYRYGNVVQYSWNAVLFSLLSFTIDIQKIQKVFKLAYQLSCFLFFVCYYFEYVEHGSIFLLFEHSLHLTETRMNFYVQTYLLWIQHVSD